MPRSSPATPQTSPEGLPAGAAHTVLAARDYLAVAPAAVRGRLDVPIPTFDDALPVEPRDGARLTELADELGIQNSVRRVQAAIAGALAVVG